MPMSSSLPRRILENRKVFSPLFADTIVFQKLPTTIMDVEYFYDLSISTLKIHIYLRPELQLREVWETLAESFGPENLRWSKEIPYRFRDGTFITGSIYIGMKVGFDRMHSVLSRLLDIDRQYLTKRR